MRVKINIHILVLEIVKVEVDLLKVFCDEFLMLQE